MFLSLPFLRLSVHDAPYFSLKHLEKLFSPYLPRYFSPIVNYSRLDELRSYSLMFLSIPIEWIEFALHFSRRKRHLRGE